jgi:hypothetical protein
MHTLTLRWFDVVAGGVALHSENLEVDVAEGIATVQAGSAVPLPVGLLRRGQLWIGISVDGGPELVPRTVLASVPYALMAERALVAEALAPEVTGVVTSVNEIAGAVEVVGGLGVRVQRTGHTLTLSADGAIARGVEPGVRGQHLYRITMPKPLPSPITISATVRSDTFVGVSVAEVDVAAGTFTLVTSAPLLDTESIEWIIY